MSEMTDPVDPVDRLGIARVPADLYSETDAQLPILVDSAIEDLHVAIMAFHRGHFELALEHLVACKARVGAAMAVLHAPPATRPD